MRILQICHKPPVPALDGGCIAMNAITQGLIKAGHTVKVLAISTLKHPFQENDISTEYKTNTLIESTFVDTEIYPKDALLNLLKGQSYNISRFYDESFEQLIIQSLKNNEFDIVHLESLFVAPYIDAIRKVFSGKVVLRAHNIEHRIWDNLSSSEKNPIKKKYLSLLANHLKKFELQTIQQVDGIVSISENDGEFFKSRCNTKTTSIPCSIDIEINETVNNGFFFLGSLDWQPNIEGIKWMHASVLSFLCDTVKIAGRNADKSITELKNIHLIGEVDSAKDFMKKSGIMLVPLFSGSGIRIKILEAMAWGIPVVATTKAIEGINAVSGVHLYVSDDPTEFANYANDLYSNKEMANKMSIAAQELIRKNYSSETLTNQLVNFYESL